MHPDLVTRVKKHPTFVDLVQKRNRLSWQIAILMCVIYFAFVFLVAFDRQILAIKLGATLTLAFPLGLGVILSAIVLTGFYVARANRVYDQMTREIVEDAR